ncbi:MAG: hypothetical protein KatS3mg111_2418 [Pirellulaceae bacterium]|nr:MAG: hypothetical protein KatS3mg111_2418 [Pirellulaceae bacterium]
MAVRGMHGRFPVGLRTACESLSHDRTSRGAWERLGPVGEKTRDGLLSDGSGGGVQDGAKCIPATRKPLRSLNTILPKDFYLGTDHTLDGKGSVDCRSRQAWAR